MDLSTDTVAIKGYRYPDLLKSKIVTSRSDLTRKIELLGFPKPVKTGLRAIWWPAAEVEAWLKARAAMRE